MSSLATGCSFLASSQHLCIHSCILQKAWTVLTNCREALQGRELTSILLEKYSSGGNFIAGFPHKLVKSSTIKFHDKRLTKHRPVRVQHLSLHSPHHASHCSHSCQKSIRDECLHTSTSGEPCTASTNTGRALNNTVQSHNIARLIYWGFHPETPSLPL